MKSQADGKSGRGARTLTERPEVYSNEPRGLACSQHEDNWRGPSVLCSQFCGAWPSGKRRGGKVESSVKEPPCGAAT